MKIKFLLDENMPFALLEFLTDRGYETTHLKKIEKVGIKNGEVYKFAEKDNSWIITRDSDFKNFHKFIEHNIRGIVVFTVTDIRTQNILNLMKRFFEVHSEKLTSKHLIIIEDKEVKIYASE